LLFTLIQIIDKSDFAEGMTPKNDDYCFPEQRAKNNFEPCHTFILIKIHAPLSALQKQNISSPLLFKVMRAIKKQISSKLL